MAWRKDLVKCGAFTESVYPEDYDLCFRWRDNDIKIIPGNKIIHLWRDRIDRASRTDKNYADNSFLQLKINWFLKSDYDNARPLVIWGAGKKGKRLARLLNEKNISFGWVSNNEEKIGKEIRGVEVRHFEIIKKLKAPQIIIVVAAPDGQAEIRGFLNSCKLEPLKNYFFFC